MIMGSQECLSTAKYVETAREKQDWKQLNKEEESWMTCNLPTSGAIPRPTAMAATNAPITSP